MYCRSQLADSITTMNHRQAILVTILLSLMVIALQISDAISTQLTNFRRWWVRPYLRNRRDLYGAFSTLFAHFKLEDMKNFITLLE